MIYSCPKCGIGIDEYSWWRQCPMHNGEIVCTGCCYKCKYYNAEMHICLWHTKNPQIDYEKQIKKLEQKIESLAERSRYLYRTNKPKAAAMVEAEEMYYRRKLKEIERKKQNE